MFHLVDSGASHTYTKRYVSQRCKRVPSESVSHAEGHEKTSVFDNLGWKGAGANTIRKHPVVRRKCLIVYHQTEEPVGDKVFSYMTCPQLKKDPVFLNLALKVRTVPFFFLFKCRHMKKFKWRCGCEPLWVTTGLCKHSKMKSSTGAKYMLRGDALYWTKRNIHSEILYNRKRNYRI